VLRRDFSPFSYSEFSPLGGGAQLWEAVVDFLGSSQFSVPRAYSTKPSITLLLEVKGGGKREC